MRALLLALGASVFAVGLASAQGSTGPSFAGTWRLNLRDSDDPRERMQRAMEDVPAPRIQRSYGGGGTTAGGGGGTAPTGARPAGGAGGAAGAGRSPGRDRCSPLARLQQPPAELRIEQTDSTVTMHGGSCPPMVFYLDGRITTDTLATGDVVQTTSTWKGDKLEAEGKVGESTSQSAAFTADQRRGRLVAEFRLSTPQLLRTFRMRLVYDRIREGGA